MIMEPCVALKRNICIYLIVYINFYSFTDLSGGSASQRGDFVCCCFFFNAFPQRLLPKQKHSQTWGELLHIQLGGGVCGLGVLPPLQPFASWLWGDPAPQSPCPLACLQMWLQRWGCAVHPWCFNQKALLVRVLSSMLCICVYPKCTWGLPQLLGS